MRALECGALSPLWQNVSSAAEVGQTKSEVRSLSATQRTPGVHPVDEEPEPKLAEAARRRLQSGDKAPHSKTNHHSLWEVVS